MSTIHGLVLTLLAVSTSTRVMIISLRATVVIYSISAFDMVKEDGCLNSLLQNVAHDAPLFSSQKPSMLRLVYPSLYTGLDACQSQEARNEGQSLLVLHWLTSFMAVNIVPVTDPLVVSPVFSKSSCQFLRTNKNMNRDISYQFMMFYAI